MKYAVFKTSHSFCPLPLLIAASSLTTQPAGRLAGSGEEADQAGEETCEVVGDSARAGGVEGVGSWDARSRGRGEMATPAPSGAAAQLPPQIANLISILRACLSHQQQDIKAAEEQLKLLEKTQGQASNLLQVSRNESSRAIPR